MEDPAPAQPTSEQPSPKPERNWKKISLFLLIFLFLITLVGVGVYLLIPRPTEEPASPTQNQDITTVKKESEKERGIVYLKLTGGKDNRGNPLGDLWEYNLSSGKKRALTKGGEVGTAGIDAVMKLSPDGKKLAYKKGNGSVRSVWVYNFGTKTEEKLDEVKEKVTSTEYASIDHFVWKSTSKSLAYLVNIREVQGDPREIKKNTIHVIDLENNKKTTYDLPLPTGDQNTLLTYDGNEIYYWSLHDACGDVSMKAFSLVTKTTKDHINLLSGFAACPRVLGSPDSTKIAIDGFIFKDKKFTDINKIKVTGLINGNKELLNINVENPVGVGGWVTDSDAYIYFSKEADKIKVTINNFKTKKVKFALFKPSLSIPDSFFGGVKGFADNTTVVVYKTNTDTQKTSYSVLDLENATETKLPFQTTDWLSKIVLVEDL